MKCYPPIQKNMYCSHTVVITVFVSNTTSESATIAVEFILVFRKAITVRCSVMSNSLRPHGPHGAHQAPLFMGFSRQEYWSGLPFPSPGESS